MTPFEKLKKELNVMHHCQTETLSFGNIWMRKMIFHKKGMIKDGHIHDFDHISYVMRGKVEAFRVDTGESLGIFKQDDHILVPKGLAHSIISLEDNSSACCLQALRDIELQEVILTDFNNPRFVQKEAGKICVR